MITITKSAALQIQEMSAESDTGEKMLRILVEDGGCSGKSYGMSFDSKKDDDTVIDSEGVTLIIDPESLAFMKGSTINFDDGLTGKGFEINNPNAESTCGCGRSFN